jgi:hypothetical protein
LILISVSLAALLGIGGLWLNSNFPAVDPIGESRRTLPLISLLIAGIQGVICSIQTRQLLSKFW